MRQLDLTFEAPQQMRRIWPVRELVDRICERVEQEYGDIWVEGEISNCRPAPSGHLYFTLKDADAQLPVVLFRRQSLLLRFKPEDFRFEQEGGQRIQAVSAGTVVKQLLDHASRGDVGRLIMAYEMALFGNAKVHSTNGYESRRQDYLAVGSTKLKAASAASAIALVATRLNPGQSTDGAVFYPSKGKPLGAGRLMVDAAAEMFEFPVEAEAQQRSSR